MYFSSGTINSWMVIFVLPINSALNPILYTLTTSFFREQVELLLCRWQRQSALKKDRKSLTSSTIYMEPSRHTYYPAKGFLPRQSLADMDARCSWLMQGWRGRGGYHLLSSVVCCIHLIWLNSHDWFYIHKCKHCAKGSDLTTSQLDLSCLKHRSAVEFTNHFWLHLWLLKHNHSCHGNACGSSTSQCWIAGQKKVHNAVYFTLVVAGTVEIAFSPRQVPTWSEPNTRC